MAEFSSDIGPIQNTIRANPRPLKTSVDLTPIAGLVGNLASGFIRQRREDERQEFLQEFRSQATSVVDEALSGEESAFGKDGQTFNVLGSGARRTVQKIKRAGDSGKLTPAQMFDRINALTKETIATRPEMAGQIRDEVRALVGFDTRQQAVKNLIESSQDQNTVAESFMNTVFQQAIKSGNVVLDENGQPNLERTVARQHSFNAKKNAVAMEMEQLKLEEQRRELQGQPTNLTAQERKDENINKWASVYEEEFNHQVEQVLSAANLVGAEAISTEEERQVEDLGPVANRLGQSFLSYLQSDMSRQGVEPTIQREIVDLFSGRLDRISDVFADQEFGTLPQLKREADRLKTTLDIEIHEALPLIKTLRQAGGDMAASAIIETLSSKNQLNARASVEVGNFITDFLEDKPNTPNRSKLLLQAHKAKLDMLSLPENEARQLMTDSVKSLQQLNNRGELDTQSLQSYSEASKNVLAAITQLDDPEQLKRANRIFSTPSFDRHLNRLGEIDPDQADLLADHARSLNVDLLRFDVPNLKKELSGFMGNSVQLVYNGNSAQYEVDVDRNKLSSELAKFTKVDPNRLRERTDRQINEFRAKANELNGNLNAIARFNKWDTDAMGQLNDKQVKQFHAVVSHSVAGGIPLKEGTSLDELPFSDQEFPSEAQAEDKIEAKKRTFNQQVSEIRSFMVNNISKFSEQTAMSLSRSGIMRNQNAPIRVQLTEDGKLINAETGEELNLDD